MFYLACSEPRNLTSGEAEVLPPIMAVATEGQQAGGSGDGQNFVWCLFWVCKRAQQLCGAIGPFAQV